MTTQQQLTDARQQVETYRAQYAKAFPGTKVWREAGENLHWWIGKASMLSAMAAKGL